MPQLDGLRALAVGGVLLAHFQLIRNVPWLGSLRTGSLGVDLFFVLSGFLITSILLRGRQRVEAGHQTPGFTLRRFYARRFLRIFPLYYATLALLAAFGVTAILDHWPWHVLYATNFAKALGADTGPAAHLWSLAVEEHFYLAWPWVVLLAPRRRLVPALLVAAAFSIALRAGLWWAGAGTVPIRQLTFSCFDALGGGSLLAIAVARVGVDDWRLRWGTALCAVAGALWILPGVGVGAAPWPSFAAWSPLGSVPLFAWLVLRAARGHDDWLGRALAAKPMVALGRISYGVYVFHYFVWWGVGQAAAAPGLGWLYWQLPRAALSLVLTLALARASWVYFEAPLQALKRYLPYEGTRAPDSGDTYTRSNGAGVPAAAGPVPSAPAGP